MSKGKIIAAMSGALLATTAFASSASATVFDEVELDIAHLFKSHEECSTASSQMAEKLTGSNYGVTACSPHEKFDGLWSFTVSPLR